MQVRKIPYTFEELFSAIQKRVENAGIWDESLIDYVLPDNARLEIRDIEFNVCSQVSYGINEGIYVDIYLSGAIGEKKEYKHHRIGVLKSLDTSREAMRAMAAIGADFVSELTSYVNGNIDDFVWQGYSVYAYGSNGSRAWGLYCDALSEADKKYEEYKLKYPQVRLWDMENRELLKDSLLR